MKGFLKRDWALLFVNLKFYLVFIVGMFLLSLYTDFASSFVSLYLILISIMNLFAYDEANRWMGYAAAAPWGRKAMVDARYILSVCIGVAMMAVELLIGCASMESVALALISGGAFFLYVAVVLPVFYRFGSIKSRIVFVAIMAIFIGVMTAVGSILTTWNTGFWGIYQFALPLGLVALLISWPISRAIMRGKEF